MKKAGIIILLAVLLINLCISLEPVASQANAEPSVQTVTLNPIADTYVQGGSGSDNNFGTTSPLYVRGTHYRLVYLKFDLAAMGGEISEAKLRLYKTAGSAGTVTHRVAVAGANDWTESGIGGMTYATKPSLGAGIASTDVGSANMHWVEFDVSAAFQGGWPADGTITLVVYDSGTDAYSTGSSVGYNSREAATNQPELVFSYVPEVTSLELAGPSKIAVPHEGEPDLSESYQAVPKDQAGDPLTEQSVTWSVYHAQYGSNPAGIHIDSNGALTVGSDAPAGGLDIVAQSGNITAVKEVELAALSNSQIVEEAWVALSLGDTGAVNRNLDLPSEGLYHTTIAWASDQPAYLQNDGTIFRPDPAEGNVTVGLTATISRGDSQLQKLFPITIVKKDYLIAREPEAVATLQAVSGANNNISGLTVRWNKYRMGILRYNLTGIEGNVSSAKVKFTGGKETIMAAYVNDDSWEQDTITYNTRPAIGADFAEGVLNESGQVELDITDQLQAEIANDNKLSFVIYSTYPLEENISFGASPVLEVYTDTSMTEVVSSLDIAPVNANVTAVSIPADGTTTEPFVARIRNQADALMANETATWSVVGNPIGVSITGLGQLSQLPQWPRSTLVVPEGTKDGFAAQLSVTQEAQPGFITLLGVSDTDDEVKRSLTIELLPSLPSARSHPYLLYDATKLSDIRDQAIEQPNAAKYNADKAIADSYSLNDLELLHIPDLWPWRENTFNFTTPAGAAFAELGVYVYGEGQVGFDSAELMAVNTSPAVIANPGFENGISALPDHWFADSKQGSPAFSWESYPATPYAHSNGQRYVRVANGSENDIGGWISAPIAVNEGKNYAFGIHISQEDPMSLGTFMIVRFKDANGNVLNAAELKSPVFNRITFSKRNNLPLAAFANAYMVENDTEYAEKAKRMLMYVLLDGQWGMQYYYNTGVNLDDTYLAVHMGRRMSEWSLVYDQIKDSGVIGPDEDNFIRSKFYWIADMLMNTKYYNYNELSLKKHNFNADRSSGLGMFALTFPEYAKAESVLNHAREQIFFQLDNSVGADGSWPETIRYHSAVLDKYMSFARAMERLQIPGESLLRSAKFKKMYDYLINIQTPRDAVSTIHPNGSAYPAVGDAVWSEGRGNLIHAVSEYADIDPAFSQRAKFAMDRENNAQQADLFLLNGRADTVIPVNPELGSARFDDAGLILFRQHYAQSTEDYFVINAASSNILDSHQHADRGSFSLFYRNTPLSLDSGMGDYFDGSGPVWYRAASSHNMVLFKDANGEWITSPSMAPATVNDFHASPEADFTSLTMVENNLKDAGAQPLLEKHKRHVAFVKSGFDAYIIWDEIKSGTGSQINFNTLSTSTDISGNKATAHGFNDKDLEITILQPTAPQFIQSRGLLGGGYPAVDGRTSQEQLMVEAPANQGYLSVLYPKESADAGLHSEAIVTGVPGVEAYKLQKANGDWAIAMINRNDAIEEPAIAWEDSVVNVRNVNEVFASSNGVLTVALMPESLTIFVKADSP